MENLTLGSLSTAMDCLNPLYLHNGDNPGNPLVTQLLTGENYYTWSRSMLMALTAKKKVLFINGGLPKPDPLSPEFLPWTQCNNMVLSWIINYVLIPLRQCGMILKIVFHNKMALEFFKFRSLSQT